MTKEDVTKRVEQLKTSRSQTLDRINAMMSIQFEDFNEDTEELMVSFPVEEWMLNPGDVMHGGLIATAFDIALGFHTLIVEREKTIVTTNLSLQYVKQVPLNSRLVVKSKVVRDGRSLVNLYAEGFVDDSDEIVATAVCTYMKLDNNKDSDRKMKV